MSFGILKFDKMATKFKMTSETYSFLILLSKLQFSTDFKKLNAFEASLLLLLLLLLLKIQNGGFFEDDVIFEEKRFF
jgi:hypothetical protein